MKCNFENNNQLFIGDSIDILKKLENNHIYHNKYQMIYIDPPYNTNRNDLKYNDNRSNKEFIDLLRQTINNSYFLLKETGNIFISISGKNIHIIRNICDEIYGKNNYQGSIIRIENAKKQKLGKVSLKENYEYIVVYSKDIKKAIFYEIDNENYIKYKNEILKLKKKINEKYIEEYIELKNILINEINIDIIKNLKNIWNLQENNQGLKQYKYISKDKKILRAADINKYMYCGKGYDYKLIHPITKKICKIPKYKYPHVDKINGWKLKDNNELIYIGEIEYISKNKLLCGNLILGVDENKIPDYANELEISMIPDTIINITGSDDIYLTKLFDNIKVFDYPKPIKLLEYLIKIGTKENDYILDFFAGSGTTGEAANNLNRNFTLIQKKEQLKEEIIINKDKINFISEITKKRLEKKNIKFSKYDII